MAYTTSINCLDGFFVYISETENKKSTTSKVDLALQSSNEIEKMDGCNQLNVAKCAKQMRPYIR